MLFSESKRFVFVAVPKTGSSAIRNHLVKVDPSIRKNEVLDAEGVWRDVHTHISAEEIRRLMGLRAQEYTFIAFFREPYDVLRSKYYFYANGRPARSLDQGKVGLRDREDEGIINLGTAMRVIFARIMPLPLWALIYPFKSNARFITDSSGTLAVDAIGDFARFDEESARLFSTFGYSSEQLSFPRDNVSSYDRKVQISRYMKWVISLKMPQDQMIYASIARGSDQSIDN